jgi:membrane fusion protein (multidrug efflux system)
VKDVSVKDPESSLSYNPSPKKSPNRTLWVLAIAGALVLIAAFGVTLYMRFAAFSGNMGGDFPVAVKTAQVSQGPMDWVFATRASVEANNLVDLKPEATGEIRAIHFKEGQTVEKGALLIRINGEKQLAQVHQSAAALKSVEEGVQVKSTEVDRLQDEVRAAEAEKKFAAAELTRFQSLYDREFISFQELDQKKTALELAESRYDAAVKRVTMARAEKSQADSNVSAAVSDYRYTRAVVADTMVRAPFSGVVGQKYVFLGDHVLPGQKLLTLVDNRTLKVVFQVPERYVSYIHVGNPVEVMTESFPDKRFLAETVFVDPAVDAQSRMITVKAILPDDARQDFKPGQFADVRLVLEQKRNVLTVPEEALVPQGEKNFVYVVREEKAYLQEIKTGLREPGRVEVLSGLKANERVVIGGLQKLTDGKSVMEAGNAPPPEASGPDASESSQKNEDGK